MLDQEQVIIEHLPLVRNIAFRIKQKLPAHIDIDDLFSAGVMGLLAAMRKYVPDGHATFAAYASIRIRGAILDELRKTDWVPRRIRGHAHTLNHARELVEQRMGRPPTDTEVAGELGITVHQYEVLIKETALTTCISFDEESSLNTQGRLSPHETIRDESDVTGRERLEEQELIEVLRAHIATLPEKQRRIISLHFEGCLDFRSIGKELGLTGSRVGQLYQQAILTLKTRFREEHIFM